MKDGKVVTILGVIAFVVVLMAVKNFTDPPTQLTQIAVTGTAELSVEADEIYLTLVLTDYYLEQQQGSLNVESYRTKGPSLATIEAEAIEQLTQAGMNAEAMRLTAAGQGSFYDRVSGQSRTYNTRTYEIKLNNFNLADKLLQTTLPYRVERFEISRYSHSNLPALSIKAKELALQNARDTADHLAIGYGKVKRLLYVSDGQTNLPAFNPMAKMAMTSPMAFEASEVTPSITALKDLVIKARVEAVFLLKKE